MDSGCAGRYISVRCHRRAHGQSHTVRHLHCVTLRHIARRCAVPRYISPVCDTSTPLALRWMCSVAQCRAAPRGDHGRAAVRGGTRRLASLGTAVTLRDEPLPTPVQSVFSMAMFSPAVSVSPVAVFAGSVRSADAFSPADSS